MAALTIFSSIRMSPGSWVSTSLPSRVARASASLAQALKKIVMITESGLTDIALNISRTLSGIPLEIKPGQVQVILANHFRTSNWPLNSAPYIITVFLSTAENRRWAPSTLRHCTRNASLHREDEDHQLYYKNGSVTFEWKDWPVIVLRVADEFARHARDRLVLYMPSRQRSVMCRSTLDGLDRIDRALLDSFSPRSISSLYGSILWTRMATTIPKKDGRVGLGRQSTVVDERWKMFGWAWFRSRAKNSTSPSSIDRRRWTQYANDISVAHFI